MKKQKKIFNAKCSDVFKERNLLDTHNNFSHLSLSKKGVLPKSSNFNRDHITKNIDTKKFKITFKNDICFNPANMKFNVICRNKYGTGIFSPIYVTLECININPTYAEYMVINQKFINRARRFEQGTIYERMSVSSKDFLKVNIYIHEKEEQEKIGNFFKTMDEEIELLEREVEILEKKKKYYLQNMFC